jgi:HSP20 family protein
MADTGTKVPVNEATKDTSQSTWGWPSLGKFRREMDRLLEDFRFDFGRLPFSDRSAWQKGMSWGSLPSVDIVEKGDGYEISAELPGADQKDLDVKYASGMLTVSGEKRGTREEKKSDYHLSERHYGSFQRSFAVPEGIDADKLQAIFKNGILTVVLPKSAEAQKKERKIAISSG